MAVRSGAGTGVVVSLVVFVLTTVFLLILSIVFYAGKSKVELEKANADAALAVYVKPAERSGDTFKGFEAAAKDNGQSVARYLNGRYEEVMNFAGGDAAGGISKLKADLGRYMKETDTVRAKMTDMSRDLAARQTEIEGLNGQVKTLSDQISEKEAQIKQLTEAHQAEVAAVEGRILSYRDAGEDYRKRLESAIDEMNKAKDNLVSKYESEKRSLQDENDNLGREMSVMRGKILEFEKARDAARMKGGNPAMLVDGRIIDAPGSADQVFIDRGKKDRIVVGMTFEVYGESSQIVVNKLTGEIGRGKASLQVMKVGDTTSTCKITRSIPGQPIIRNDLLVNAVYDPSYKFKFLMHGKFDIDGDGRPTEPEAEYLRSLVMEWGGIVVTGDDLPGDLDFLVLGVEPPKPAPPPADAPAVVIQDWVKKNEANDRYNQLFRQARDAQIPVLNANRFFVLIGHTDR